LLDQRYTLQFTAWQHSLSPWQSWYVTVKDLRSKQKYVLQSKGQANSQGMYHPLLVSSSKLLTEQVHTQHITGLFTAYLAATASNLVKI
jgi:hypothetical protein